MKKGFTLIEVTVAIFVITVGIVGIYTLVPKIISISSANIDTFIASQLAREGIEIVRNIRDTNWLEGNSWDDGLNNCAGGCEIDYNDPALVTFQNRYLKIDPNNPNKGFYNYENGKDTKFKRKIVISGTDILNINVEIIWPGEDSPFLVKENLYDWK